MSNAFKIKCNALNHCASFLTLPSRKYKFYGLCWPALNTRMKCELLLARHPPNVTPNPGPLAPPSDLWQPPKSANLRRSQSLAAEQFIAAPAHAKWILVLVWPTGVLFDFGFSVLPIFVFVFGACRCPKLQSIIFILTGRSGDLAVDKDHRATGV